VIRGGGWLKDAADARLATRNLRAQMASQCYSIGIRIVRNSWPVEVSKPAIIDPEINGPNVTKNTYQGSALEQSFVQAGPKRDRVSQSGAQFRLNRISSARLRLTCLATAPTPWGFLGNSGPRGSRRSWSECPEGNERPDTLTCLSLRESTKRRHGSFG
jgi:hypothetical protein